MKKIIIFLLLFDIYKVNALTDIKIDNNDLIPNFDKNIKLYNYYTNNNEISIFVSKEENEEVIYNEKVIIEKENKIEINSSIDGKYIINVFKNYKKDNSNEIYLEELKVLGYDINFDKNIHEYSINIDNENYLDIDYEISNDNAYVSIEGNGNLNKSDNVIKININNEEEYIIHAYKTVNVSQIKEEKIKEMSNTKKEIVKLIIITISCIIVFIFYYLLFINKTILNI